MGADSTVEILQAYFLADADLKFVEAVRRNVGAETPARPERAVILSQGQRLKLDLSSADFDGSVDVATFCRAAAEFVSESEFRELEKSNLIGALRRADWRVSGPGGAAELLGIKPSTLSYRMRAFGITPPK